MRRKARACHSRSKQWKKKRGTSERDPRAGYYLPVKMTPEEIFAAMEMVTGPNSDLMVQMREEAQDRIETLLAFLDVTTPDPDREPAEDAEPDVDGEPGLSALESLYQGAWAAGGTQDREGDPAEDGIADSDGLAEQTVGEPSLGSFDRLTNQVHAWQLKDRWSDNMDAELDTADREPSLGSVTSSQPELMSQEDWAAGNRDDRENDAGDNCEDDPAERGIADGGGLAEATGLVE
jgi:hypothetical protein